MTKSAIGILDEHCQKFVNIKNAETAPIDLALLLQALGITDEAIRRYREAMDSLERGPEAEKNAGYVLSARNLTVLLEDRGDGKGARKIATKLLRGDHGLYSARYPKTSIGCKDLAVFYRDNGRPDRSVGVVIHRGPDDGISE